MADRCAGCMNKYKFREKPTDCPKCRKSFCHTCLNPKKVKEQGITCVYCSQKQKQVNKQQTSEILQNFHERYYKHVNQGPPIVTKIQSEIQAARVSPNPSQQRRVMLDPADQALEDRFRKLREDRISNNPPSTEDEIKDRLKKLTDTPLKKKDDEKQQPIERQTDTGGNDPIDPLGRFQKSDMEKTQDLVNRTMDEVRLDENLDVYHQKHDDDLMKRFDELKGINKATTTNESTMAPLGVGEGHKDIDLPQSEIDPESVLNDLTKFQMQQEGDVLRELQSTDIQNVLQQVRKDSDNPNDIHDIQYPKIPTNNNDTNSTNTNTTSQEIFKLINEAENENKTDKILQEMDKEFVEVSSKRLERLHDDDPDSDTEVKSKPNNSNQPNLDFTWQHFGQGNVVGATGCGIKWNKDDSYDLDDEDVEQLIQQMLAESKLEEKLEKSGYDKPVENKREPNTVMKKPDVEVSSKVSGAAGPYRNFGEEELPWCCICNHDAVIRCHDCDDDLYCSRCFSDGHEQFGMFDHQYTLYKSPKTV